MESWPVWEKQPKYFIEADQIVNDECVQVIPLWPSQGSVVCEERSAYHHVDTTEWSASGGFS